MKIQKITFECGNDFSAIMQCEHCGNTQSNSSGYHDNHYHTQVIPALHCAACGLDRHGNAAPIIEKDLHADPSL